MANVVTLHAVAINTGVNIRSSSRNSTSMSHEEWNIMEACVDAVVVVKGKAGLNLQNHTWQL